MNCYEVKNIIPLYGKDELTVEEIESVSIHLKECINCSNEYKELISTREMIYKVSEKIDDFFIDIDLSTKLNIDIKTKSYIFSSQALRYAAAAILIILVLPLIYMEINDNNKIQSLENRMFSASKYEPNKITFRSKEVKDILIKSSFYNFKDYDDQIVNNLKTMFVFKIITSVDELSEYLQNNNLSFEHHELVVNQLQKYGIK